MGPIVVGADLLVTAETFGGDLGCLLIIRCLTNFAEEPIVENKPYKKKTKIQIKTIASGDS